MAQRSLRYTFLERLILNPYKTLPLLVSARSPLPPRIEQDRSTFSRRYASAYAARTPTTTINSRLPEAIAQTLDERIGAMRAHLVDADQKMHEAASMRDLLSKIDRTTEHLRKVGDGPDGVPVVKIVTRQSLVELVRNKEAVAKKKDVSELAKSLELNWAIGENDLRHRLGRIEEFLKEGRRVEVLIAPKRRGRRATPEEISGLLERLEEVVEGVEGAEEWKEKTGTPGKVMELYYKGREEKQSDLRQQARSRLDEKAEKKEREKEEKKSKQEARAKRKEEERQRMEAEKKRLGIPV